MRPATKGVDVKPSTINVRGHRVSNRTNRRFVVVGVRPEPRVVGDKTFVPFAEIVRRTDDITRARKVASKYGFSNGAFAVVVNSETGEEI